MLSQKVSCAAKWVAWDVCAELRPTLLSPGVSNVAPYRLLQAKNFRQRGTLYAAFGLN